MAKNPFAKPEKKPSGDPRTMAAFHEVMHNEPSTVKQADVSAARKEKMRTAIALSKAKKAGANIPPPKGK